MEWDEPAKNWDKATDFRCDFLSAKKFLQFGNQILLPVVFAAVPPSSQNILGTNNHVDCVSRLRFAYTILPIVMSIGLLFALPAWSEVRVFVQDTNGVASLGYECTAGEVIRAFALDVSVDRGQIVNVFSYFRGPGTAVATGYGIFPASFRDHIVVNSATNIDWSPVDYSPLANPADNPDDTLPGLQTSGVTLEFGAIWDTTLPAAMPGPRGTLCALLLSQPANVSVAANASRGGIVSAFPGVSIVPAFMGAPVGPLITSAVVQNGVMTVSFHGGELQTATSIDGPWSDTGNVSGDYAEPVGTNPMKFYRVLSP